MNEIPMGWSNTDLSSLIVRIMGGGTPSKSNVVFFQGKIPFMTVKDMKERFPLDTIDHITEEAVENSSTIVVPADTLIVATRMSLGKIVRPRFETAINQDLKALFFAEGIDKTFVEHWWRSRSKLIQNLGTGTTVKGIRLEDIHSLSIDIPPLNEQKRIADKLDRLLAKVDNCRERLDRIPLILSRFRSSILTQAFSGELTRIFQNSNKYSEEWSYERAVDVCEKVQSGGTPREGFIDNPGIPFLKVYNIVNQKVDFEYRPQFILEKINSSSMSKSQAKPGDVLMNIVGPPLGKVAIVPNSYPEWNINQAITLFRPSSRITTGWLYYLLCSGINVSSIINETRGSAGQSNISLSQCRDFVFPVPSVQEQDEIVHQIEKLFNFADRLESRYQTARAQIDKLTPALLDKAFKGELVPQDPTDEPASVLLAKIQQARANPENQTSKQPKTPRKPSIPKVKMLTRSTIQPSHLADILKNSGSLTAEALWNASKLSIDDFYDQLKAEELQELLKEVQGELSTSIRLLEAI